MVESQDQRLLELAEEVELFHPPDGTAYADVRVAGHRETWPVRSKGFEAVADEAILRRD